MAAEPAPVDEGSGPLVLLVHGQPGSGAEWAGVARHLSGDHHVVAPDRPGWGANPRPATTLRDNAEALVRVVTGSGLLGAGEQMVVVGHSLGGGIAIEMALERPDLVDSLVLVSSVGVGQAVSGMDRVLALPLVGTGVLRAGSAVVHRAVRAVKAASRARPASGLLEHANRLPAVRSVMAEGDREMVGRDWRSFLTEQRALLDETPQIEARLPRLKTRCAVIHGVADRVVAVGAARMLAEAIPGAELVLVRGAGHRLAFECPDLVAATVRRYTAMSAGPSDPAAGPLRA